MKMNRLVLNGLGLLALASVATADQGSTSKDLAKAREQVVRQYIVDLQKADYKDITQLFEKNGIVISTSRGMVDAKEFFYSFLPNIASAHTELHQYFNNPGASNRISARFHFTFKLKDGEEGEGEYVDEFVFSSHSVKLAAVYMFENLKFKNDSTV